MRTLIAFVIFATAVAADTWRVTEDTLPVLRKFAMQDIGKVPTPEDIAWVDSVLRQTRYTIEAKDGETVLTIQREDANIDPTIYKLKRQDSGVLSGFREGSSSPEIFLLPDGKDAFRVWYRKPQEFFKIKLQK